MQFLGHVPAMESAQASTVVTVVAQQAEYDSIAVTVQVETSVCSCA